MEPVVTVMKPSAASVKITLEDWINAVDDLQSASSRQTAQQQRTAAAEAQQRRRGAADIANAAPAVVVPGAGTKGAVTTDVFLLGCAALARHSGEEVTGKVGPFVASIPPLGKTVTARFPRYAESAVSVLCWMVLTRDQADPAAAMSTELLDELAKNGLGHVVHAELLRQRIVGADSDDSAATLRLCQVAAEVERASSESADAVLSSSAVGIALFVESLAVDPSERSMALSKLAFVLGDSRVRLPATLTLVRVSPTISAVSRALDVIGATSQTEGVDAGAAFASVASAVLSCASHDLCRRRPECVTLALELALVSLASGDSPSQVERIVGSEVMASLDSVLALEEVRGFPQDAQLGTAAAVLRMHIRAKEKGVAVGDSLQSNLTLLRSLPLSGAAFVRSLFRALSFMECACSSASLFPAAGILGGMPRTVASFLSGSVEGVLLCSTEICEEAFASLLELAGHIAGRRMDCKGFAFFLKELGSTLRGVTEWGRSGASDECTARTIVRVITSGVRQAVCGTNYYKSLLFNWLPVIGAITRIRKADSDAMKLALLEAVLRLGEPMLLDEIKAESYMQNAAPCALALLGNSTASVADFEEIVGHLLEIADRDGQQGFRLLRLSKAYETFVQVAGDANSGAVADLFRSIVCRGRRDDVRLVLEAASFPVELAEQRYAPLIAGVLGTSKGPLGAKHRPGVFGILVLAVSICAPRRYVHPDEQSPEALAQQQSRRAAIVALVEAALSPLSSRLSGECAAAVTKKEEDDALFQLKCIALFQSVFTSELADCHSTGGIESLRSLIDSRFPADVRGDPATMDTLSTLGVRADYVLSTRPRCRHIIEEMTKVLNVFLASPSLAAASGPREVLVERKKAVDAYVRSIPANVETEARLEELGYSARMWDTDRSVSITVEVEVGLNADAGLKSSLVAIAGEYSDILERIGVDKVAVLPGHPEGIASRELFQHADYLSVDEIRRRRTAAVAAIEAKLGISATDPVNSGEADTFFASRVRALLAREEEVESQAARRAAAAEKTAAPEEKTFLIKLNRSFFGCANCCGASISGCYAPQGCHAEKPIENGLRGSLAFVSVYEIIDGVASSQEIENAELLFTDQGAYVFRVYTNGHSYDTSVLWVAFLHSLVVTHHVPAVIVPRDHPTRGAFSMLARYVQPQVASAQITVQDKFWPDDLASESYYDTASGNRPEVIEVGDIVMTAENATAVPDDYGCSATIARAKTFLKSSSALEVMADGKRRKAALKRDLAGTVLTLALADIHSDDRWKVHEAAINSFARPIASFVERHISDGTCDRASLVQAVDLNYSGKRGRKLRAVPFSDADNAALVSSIEGHVHRRLAAIYAEPPSDLFRRDVFGFFELSSHLKRLCRSGDRDLAVPACAAVVPRSSALKRLCGGMASVFASNVRFREIRVLDLQQRQELMRWIFRNEQRVWANRGGRHSSETIKQFLDMASDGRVVPGIVATTASSRDGGGRESATVLGYTIGEFVNTREYEVVCAWVDHRARDHGIAGSMYEMLAWALHREGCDRIVCDVITGATQRFGWGSAVWRFLVAGVKLQNSWSVVNQAGNTEQFQRMVISMPRMVLFYRVLRVLRFLRSWAPSMPLGYRKVAICLVAAFAVLSVAAVGAHLVSR